MFLQQIKVETILHVILIENQFIFIMFVIQGHIQGQKDDFKVK